MIRYFIIGSLLLFSSCSRHFDAPVPDTKWDLFDSPSALPLDQTTRNKLEGIFNIEEGGNVFGTTTALKWSYTITGTDTSFHLSFFCEKEATYIICEGKSSDSSILLNGYWRTMFNTQTGIARLTITAANGGAHLLSPAPFTAGDSILITGFYGNGQALPGFPLQLRYERPLNNNPSFEIIAHRGGGRNADLLPASENSREMLLLASRFGATGVEVDIRLTSDGIPILYHDITLNERLVQRNGLLGPVKNYSYQQLFTLVRLLNGERIPTLREALYSILYQTGIRYVWLDIKYTGSLEVVKEIQTEFMQAAAAIGRSLEITIGIPDEDVMSHFLLLPGYQQIPSLIELDPADASAVNARIWAPTWTKGLLQPEVALMHAEGRRVFVWTLDVPQRIQQYIHEGAFDGILSNYPSLVAFYHYAKQ